MPKFFRGLHFRAVLVFAVATHALSMNPTMSRAESSDPAAAFVGTWFRVDSEADEADRARAIDRATDGMSPLVRSIARSVMRRSTRPVDRYEIRSSSPGLWIRADDEDPTTARLDGELDHDPNAVVRSRFWEGGFEQIWRSDDSTHGRTRWRIEAAKHHLRVTTHVEDARFSAPLVYTTGYARRE